MVQFDNIHKLVGVPVITVQLRYNGWVTEMAGSDQQQQQHSQQQTGEHGGPRTSSAAVGLDNLLYRCQDVRCSGIPLVCSSVVNKLYSNWPTVRTDNGADIGISA